MLPATDLADATSRSELDVTHALEPVITMATRKGRAPSVTGMGSLLSSLYGKTVVFVMQIVG